MVDKTTNIAPLISNLIHYVLVHEHKYGADAYLFACSNHQKLPGIQDLESRMIQMFGLNYEPEKGESLVITHVVNTHDGEIPVLQL